MMQFPEPFLHFVRDDFLSRNNLERIRDVYSGCAFKELHTDLFRFLQTSELGQEESLGFFRDRLMEVFEEVEGVDGGWIDTFASYYRSGDYLLCHDDRIENRRFAYSFYLEDYDSGELILYERDGMTVSKRVEVVSNRLVIFEVSGVSFHEVGFCEKDGRKAFTGWLNFRGVSHEDTREDLPVRSLQDYEEFPLEIDFDGDSLLFYPDMAYEFECVEMAEEGPFFSRRLERLVLESSPVPRVEGWSLQEANFYRFRVGDYILLNDRCNAAGDVYDVFFVRCNQENAEPISFDNPGHPIKYLDSEGSLVFGLPTADRTMFAVNRSGLSLFVERSTREFFLAHFVYALNK